MFRHSFLRRKKSKSGANSYFFLLAIIPSPRPPLPFSLPSFLEHSKNRVWRFAAFLFAAHLYIDIDRKRKQHAKYRHTSLFFSFLFSFSHLSPFSFSLFPSSSSSSSCFFFSNRHNSIADRIDCRGVTRHCHVCPQIRTTKAGKGASWNPVGQHSLFLATRAFPIIVSIAIS